MVYFGGPHPACQSVSRRTRLLRSIEAMSVRILGMEPRLPVDGHEPEASAHRDDVLRDLTIIQAQAQLVMRRIDRAGYVDHDDTYRRLAGMVEAVRRLTLLHR